MFKHLEMIKGDTMSFGIIVEFDGEVQELETAFFTVKNNRDDENPVFQKSLNDGIEVVSNISSEDKNEVVYRLRVAPEDTENVKAGYYYYDFEIGLNGDIFTVLNGVLNIQNDVTN